MSKMNDKSKANAWAPPAFPLEGRLPVDVRIVTKNYQKHTYEEDRFQRTPDAQGLCSQAFCCCHSLHISLFFDGTNNNDNNDTKNNHPSNIAKLFHASLQDIEANKNGYFSYYMPGVGTPFPEIGELDYSEDGLKYATGGEDRINWALVSVFDALHTALNGTPLSQDRRKKAVDSMSTWKAPLMFRAGPSKRRRVMKEVLGTLLDRVERATPKVLGVKLYIYGFSRGAAEARTFVTWLSQLFETPEGAELPSQSLIGLPVSVEFLGVLDTVASVGIANVAPFFAGHMDWADDSQLLPDVKPFRSSSNVAGISLRLSNSAHVFRSIRSATRMANTQPIPMKWCTPACTPMSGEATRSMIRARPVAVRTNFCRRLSYTIFTPKPLLRGHRCRFRRQHYRKVCCRIRDGVRWGRKHRLSL